MSDIESLVGNLVRIETASYAAIIGGSPSKGARSPLLWNAAFTEAGMDCAMVPLDTDEEGLPGLMAALADDPRYIGGAVTMPLKESIAPHLARLEPEADRIGAINAIYRGEGGVLTGANTDGDGALRELDRLTGGTLAERQALLIGCGGAGVAVAAYLVGRVGGLKLANRTADRTEAVATRLGGGTTVAGWPITSTDLEGIDLVINATSVGHASGTPASPLGTDTDSLLATLPAHTIVYDIVYQPAETPLLAAARARGLVTENGLGMNLEQAVIAFEKAVPEALSADRLRAVMSSA